MGEQILTRSGQAGAMPPAVDQALPRKAFELGECLRNRRLAEGQTLGGSGEIALLRDCDQATQMPQLDVADEGSDTHAVELPMVIEN
jgi:hypothetical protein